MNITPAFRVFCLALSFAAVAISFFYLGKASVYSELITKQNIEIEKNIAEIKRLNKESTALMEQTIELRNEVMGQRVSSETYPSELNNETENK